MLRVPDAGVRSRWAHSAVNVERGASKLVTAKGSIEDNSLTDISGGYPSAWSASKVREDIRARIFRDHWQG